MKKIILFVVFSALILCAIAAGSYMLLRSTLSQPLRIETPQTLEVAPGSTPARVFLDLEQRGVLSRAGWLRRYWQITMPNAVLQVGEYSLKPGMNVEQLLALLQSGAVLQRSVTLVEGWTFKQFRAALASAERLEQTLPAKLSAEEVMQKLDLGDVHPEGQFFPDTYLYTLGMSDRDILLRAYERMQKVLAAEWMDRAKDLPIDDPYEALILASIIERETGVPHERDEIAGVFVRRLQQGMRLQTDPTVIYGMGDEYQGRIGRANLREPTAYNTYVIDGLPPTPIAMPGREAIRAALNPKAGTSLYFVARGDGSHVFSDTLDEHNAAVRRFQIEQRAKDYRSSPAPGGAKAKESP